MISKDALKDLNIVRAVLDHYEVPFFLAYGTCLGAYRDKDFLPEDDDIDLGVVAKVPLKTKIAIGKGMEDMGFMSQGIGWAEHQEKNLDEVKWVPNQGGYQGTDRTGIIVMGRFVNFTIFFFYEDGDEYTCIPRKGVFPVLATPKKYYKKFNKIKFYEQEYNVPSPTDEYLDFTYLDWKDPTKRDHGLLYAQTHTEKQLLDRLRSSFRD